MRNLVSKNTLSLESDQYMDSHRFGKTPYFPFVMGMEYFLDCIKEDKGCVVFSNYRVDQPLMLRKDIAKDIVVNLLETQDRGYECSLSDDKDRPHISGSVEFRDEVRKRDKVCFCTDEKIYCFDKEMYKSVLPHGPHFHNNFDIVSIDENELKARQFNFSNNLKYMGHKTQSELNTNPALLDGLLQLCALHSIKFEEQYMLPTSVKSLFINFSKLNDLDVTYVVCRKVSSAVYDIAVSNSEGEIVCKFKEMTFSKLSRKVSCTF